MTDETQANETGTTTMEGVKQRVANITESLYHNPLPVLSTIAPEVIEYSDIKSLIFNALYSPVYGFVSVANVLADIEKGDGSEFAKVLRAWHTFTCPLPAESQSIGISSKGLGFLDPPDAQMAIACTDGDDQSWVDREEFENHFKKLNKLSPSAGPIWATIRLQCAHFSVRPHYRFTQPFQGNTSHPILLLGNTADPVTPLRDAIELAKGYKGAVALTQDSPGHCTLAAASECTTGYVRSYFQTGEMPPFNTTCGVEEVPFGRGLEEGEQEVRVSEEVRQRMEDVKGIREAMYAAGGGFFGRKGHV